MHRRKTAKSVNKPLPIQSIPKKAAFDDVNDIQFELELCWCVQQLQTALNSGKLSQKIAEDNAKNLKTLTSPTAPLIKKRQVMKLALGDYRSKMQQEEKKMNLASKQIKFTSTGANEKEKKSSFVKKSALLSSGKDFRFNFTVPAADNGNNESKPTEATIETPATANKPTSFNNSLQSNTGSEFKFNFVIANAPDDINFADLALNS